MATENRLFDLWLFERGLKTRVDGVQNMYNSLTVKFETALTESPL